MKLTKQKVIDAVHKLVIGYKDNALYHSQGGCPLCQIYLDDTFGGCPKTCLNDVFRNPDDNPYGFPCVSRAKSHTKLDWEEGINQDNLFEFWSEVLVLIKASSYKSVTTLSDDLRAGILLIAEKYR